MALLACADRGAGVRDDRNLDEEFVGSVHDEGVEEPFYNHLFGIVKLGDRLVVVELVGRTEGKA